MTAVAALGLSGYSIWLGKTAPARARQQQLWDDLRTVLQPLPSLFSAAQGDLAYGNDVAERPGDVAYAERRVQELASRFKEPGVYAGLLVLASKLRMTEGPWKTSIDCQRQIAYLDEEIKALAGKIPEDTWYQREREKQVHKREKQVRMRDAQRAELAKVIETAQSQVSDWISRMDRRDRRGDG